MPVLDFVCDAPGGCDQAVLERFAPLGTPYPRCPVHGQEMTVLWAGRRYSRFASFDHDGREVTSLAEVRKIESDSVRAWESGAPGAQPVIFRQFSQDRSNMDQNVFGRPDLPELRKTTRRGRPLITVREEFSEGDE